MTIAVALAKSSPFGGKAVDGAVLSGTCAPELSGTRFPYYPERYPLVTIGFYERNSAPSNFTNIESFGFSLTYPPEIRLCGRAFSPVVGPEIQEWSRLVRQSEAGNTFPKRTGRGRSMAGWLLKSWSRVPSIVEWLVSQSRVQGNTRGTFAALVAGRTGR